LERYESGEETVGGYPKDCPVIVNPAGIGGAVKAVIVSRCRPSIRRGSICAVQRKESCKDAIGGQSEECSITVLTAIGGSPIKSAVRLKSEPCIRKRSVGAIK